MPRVRHIGAGIGLAVLLALSFQLLDLVSVASRTLQLDIAAAFARSAAPNVSDELVFDHHGSSLCCEDFVRGGQLVLLVVLLSGLPLALAAGATAFATRRRSARRWPRSAGEIFRACFVLQWSSMLLSTLLTLVFLWMDWRIVFTAWQGAFLLATLTASAMALPAWQCAALAAAASAPISILGARSNVSGSPQVRMRSTTS